MATIVLPKEKFSPDRKHYPSVINQGLNCKFFNFGKAATPGVSYFNPGLVQRPDGLWLITRRSEAVRNLRIGMNSLMAFKLNEFHDPQYGHKIRCKSLFDREHFEDPRAVYHNGRTLVSCCNFIVYPNQVREKWTGAHICLQLIKQHTDNWESFQRVDPVYGNNSASLSTEKGLEKNWLWFWHKNQLHLVYNTNPHIVSRWSDEFKPVEEWKEEQELAAWAYGAIRGGTPPVFYGGLYWSFFHSSLPLATKYRRRYYMGAYAFEPFPPWNIVKFTKEPILAGSDEDPWAEKKPLVVFPCGAVMENDQWLVSMGVNDLHSAWVEIPHQVLLAKMGEKAFRIIEWVKDKFCPQSHGVIAYLPPPNVGHTQIFLKNLRDYPPSCTPDFISDYPWPDSERIPDPTRLYKEKDKIACYVFLHALELAEKRGYDSFLYLETDCRVSGSQWDKALFDRFAESPGGTIAAGNMAIFGPDNGGALFRSKLDRLTQQYGQCRHDQSAPGTAILFQGLDTDKAIAFVNGAPAVYSVKALRDVLGYGAIEAIVARMKSSDLSIGEIHGDAHGADHTITKYTHAPEIMATAGETIYPFPVRQTALESGQVKAVHPIKNRWRPRPPGLPSFYHSGDLGDIIYGLKAIQLYVGSGCARLVLGSKCYSKYPPRSPISKDMFALLQPLLDEQPYLSSVAYASAWEEWDFDLNDFRTIWNTQVHGPGLRTLCEAHCVYLGVEPLFNTDPWLTAETNRVARIIIHRSPRYHADSFPWAELVARHGPDCLFIGLQDEHIEFSRQFGKVPYFRPYNFAQMAAIINGAEWFVGNQSFPCALAIGLGRRVWQETWLQSPDCVFERTNFHNGTEFPKDFK